jgi:DNA invertase Pin-like site-specific DNA recombinase
MTTAALYIRVSTRHQVEEGFSLDEQQAVLTALAQERGWQFRLYVDAGLSGEGIDHRPALLEMLRAVQAGQHNIVAVVDESRLAREELTAAIIRDRLRRAGVTLVTPTGERDLTDPSGSFVASVLGAAATLEQGLRTAKMSAGLRATVRAGFWPGGPPPYGYQPSADPAGSAHTVLIINEREAAILRDAADLILDHGHTTWSATKVLNATGRLTRSGSPWYYRNLAFQLKKRLLTGTFTYKQRGHKITAQVPAILNESRWQALQAAIRAIPGPEDRANHFYPLTGFLRCACGGTISGVYRVERGSRFYKCTRATAPLPPDRRCPHYPRYIPADHLEQSVWAAIHQLLTDPDRLQDAARRHLDSATETEPLHANQRATFAHRLDQLDLEETAIIRTHARDQIDDTQLANSLAQIADERHTLRGHLAQLDLWDHHHQADQARLAQLHRLATEAAATLSNASPQQQRRIYELLQLQIHVAPDRTLDIQGSIPTHGTLGEVSTETLPVRAPRRPRCGRGAGEGTPGPGRAG